MPDSRANKSNPWRDSDLLETLYWQDGLSMSEIADELDTSKRTISRWFERHGIPVKDANTPTTGADNAAGGKSNVYEYVLDDDGQRVMVHRLVAIAEYGFDAVANADAVHHIDGNAWVNSRENVEPVTRSEHQRRHYSD